MAGAGGEAGRRSERGLLNHPLLLSGETIVHRDAGCTIVEPTRGDRQRAWGLGLPWQREGAHVTSKRGEVSEGGGGEAWRGGEEEEGRA